MTENLKKAFRDALELELRSPSRQAKIRRTVAKRLGSFPEYTCMWSTAEKCTSHISNVVYAQFEKAEGYSNRLKFQREKLEKFQKDPNYIQEYLTTATHTYCTAKQVKCNQGRSKVVDADGNVIQTEKKRGKAARAVDGNDKLEIAILSTSFGLANISDEAIESTTEYLKKLHLNDKEIRCFWDRLDGQTFVEMAKEYQESSASKEKSVPDLYRKRYSRLMKKIGNKRDKVFDIMTRDSHLSNNQALSDGGFYVSTE